MEGSLHQSIYVEEVSPYRRVDFHVWTRHRPNRFQLHTEEIRGVPDEN